MTLEEQTYLQLKRVEMMMKNSSHFSVAPRKCVCLEEIDTFKAEGLEAMFDSFEWKSVQFYILQCDSCHLKTSSN